ncbi:class I SAM-dependent methyltransferase [Streptomyces sp. NPDC001502]|uniref:class I SAM-dependent methyltransferase n=1 Tax=Streptomyces sp. NPDC001502 TaxID=3364578 RepID=UPI0036AD9B86
MTAIPPVHSEILDFYANGNEGGRLTSSASGRLELERTRELLRRHLPPPPGRIADIGGGPGAHARWLTEAGYEVHLVDPVPGHIEQAATIPGVTTELGDARTLSAPAGVFEAALLLGPLYHLEARTDRLTALAEARRTVRPGGLVAAAAISRYAPLLDYAAAGALGEEGIADRVRHRLATGYHPAPQTGLTTAFTIAYFHTAAGLADELTEAGLRNVHVYGIEGPGWPMVKAIERHTGTDLTGTPMTHGALVAARLGDDHPELTDMSAHLLAIART